MQALVSYAYGTLLMAGGFLHQVHAHEPSPAALYAGPAVVLSFVFSGVACGFSALCYAELATTFPNVGGEYHFLHKAYGREVSFLYAWARSTVIVSTDMV